MKFWLTVSNNGGSTRLYHKWINFYLFWFRFGCAWLWLAAKFHLKWRRLLFFVVATPLSCKTMCTVTAKQLNCRLLVLKRNIQNVEAGFSLFTVGEYSRFIGRNTNTLFSSTRSTIHISNRLLYFVVLTQFFLLYLVDWIGTLSNNCLLGTEFIFFFSQKKRVLSDFVLFTCSCNTKGTSWTNNQAPYLPQP